VLRRADRAVKSLLREIALYVVLALLALSCILILFYF